MSCAKCVKTVLSFWTCFLLTFDKFLLVYCAFMIDMYRNTKFEVIMILLCLNPCSFCSNRFVVGLPSYNDFHWACVAHVLSRPLE